MKCNARGTVLVAILLGIFGMCGCNNADKAGKPSIAVPEDAIGASMLDGFQIALYKTEVSRNLDPADVPKGMMALMLDLSMEGPQPSDLLEEMQALEPTIMKHTYLDGFTHSQYLVGISGVRPERSRLRFTLTYLVDERATDLRLELWGDERSRIPIGPLVPTEAGMPAPSTLPLKASGPSAKEAAFPTVSLKRLTTKMEDAPARWDWGWWFADEENRWSRRCGSVQGGVLCVSSSDREELMQRIEVDVYPTKQGEVQLDSLFQLTDSLYGGKEPEVQAAREWVKTVFAPESPSWSYKNIGGLRLQRTTKDEKYMRLTITNATGD